MACRGVIREVGETVVLADNLGKEITLKKEQIESRTISPLSAMPADVSEKLPEAEFSALMAWLLTQTKK